MITTYPQLVPCVSTSSGSCLTAANWQELGIQTVSYHLDHLLMRPGLDSLLNLDSLRTYCGWEGRLVLNARMLSFNDQGKCQIRSSYDGALINLDYQLFWQLVKQLKVDIVLLPSCSLLYDWIENNPVPNANFLMAYQEKYRMQGNRGYYFLSLETTPIPTSEEIFYLEGEELAFVNKDLNYHFIEVNFLTEDAVKGIVYTATGAKSILDSVYANCFALLDDNCTCPSCSQHFTFAYLHHLLQHTPLLAQRLLIQHNIFQAQESLQVK